MVLKSNPLTDRQLTALNELVKEMTPNQVIWISGFLEGKLAGLNHDPSTTQVQGNSTEEKKEPKINLTILYGTETGNAQLLSDKLAEKASFKNISAKVFGMYDFDYKKLKEEENVAIIVSTHGEGEPPDMADDFYKYLTGKRAPKLDNLFYSVLALGDKTYKYFCKTGEDIDAALKKLGAFNIAPLVKCDVDYELDSEIWMNNLLLNLKPSVQNKEAIDRNINKDEIIQVAEQPANIDISEYSKKNPYLANVLEKIKITGNESDKEVYHLELSIEGSGITYEPGDSVGIFSKNPETLVQQIIQKNDFNPDQKVFIGDDEVSIADALTNHLEITILTFDTLRKYFEKTQNPDLGKLINDDQLLDEYLFGHDLLDLLEDFPFEWNANKLVDVLRQLPPRLYSISSSQESVGDEIHATVSLVRYERKNRMRLGACSSHLVDNIEIDDQIPIYIHRNPAFKLPANGSKIIMVGAGTGIAPYRAFMQQRESQGIKRGAWLFFGDRRFQSDFLYQTEWQKLLKSEYLEKMDVAFSRDQNEKVYVQHKMRENQNEIFEWIEDGAVFYLCGDMKKMAKDVNKTLLEIVETQGNLKKGEAEKYLKNMKKEKRLQIDVY